jgi:hypothetical protein
MKRKKYKEPEVAFGGAPLAGVGAKSFENT